MPGPAAEVLKKMHSSNYILHARAGQLAKMPVEKARLPHDPEASPQSIQLVRSPEGAIFARLASVICKSTDGGRTWISYQRASAAESMDRPRNFQILRSGRFVGIAGNSKPGAGLAVIRQQRPLLPGDPPDLVQRNGGYTNWPYKTVFSPTRTTRGATGQVFVSCAHVSVKPAVTLSPCPTVRSL